MSGNSPCDSSHLDEENVDSKGGNKGWWSTKGKSADGMKGHKGKTGQGKGKTGKGKIDTGDAGPTVKGTGKTGDVLETVKGMGKTGDGVKGAKGKTEDTLETVKGMGKTGDGVKGSKGKNGHTLETVKGVGKTGVKGSEIKTGDTLETVKGMGKTGDGGVKGSEGKTGDTLETVKGMGKTGDGGVKGLGKTGDVGVKGSKGKTNGKTGDKGKTGDLEHIPSASGGPAAPAAEATEPPPVAASPAQLQRSDSSVSINGIMMTAADKTKRVKVLTEEQKHAVLTLTDPSQIPIQERRRQYNAINRRITSSAKSFPPGLVEKWRDADGDSTKKFEFLKCFLVDPSFQSMHIETWFKEQHVKKNTARYVELPLDELEQKFDPEWLKTKVVACQTGKPHPQDPENPRKRLYKVFDRIEESRSDQCSVGSGVHGHADISDNKAHRQAISDVITTKMSTSGVASSLDVLFSGQTSEQQKNKKAKQPKAPKVLSPEEQKKKDFDRSMTQLASLATKARNTAANLTATGIAHQEGLVSTLGKCHHQLNDITYQLNDMVFKGYPLDRLVEALDGHEVAVKDADSRIKDAETIVQSHERRLKAEKRKAEAKGRPQAKGKSKAKRAKKEENTAEIKPEVKAENGEVKDEDDEEEEMDDDLDGEELEDGEWPMDDDLNNVG